MSAARGNGQTLIVPINLQALRVSVAPADFAGPTTQYERLPFDGSPPAANTSATVAVDLAANSVARLQPGVHLHWQLPDALTHGVQQPDGTLSFPPTPDRFLVSRVLRRRGTATPVVRQWVIESDRLMGEPEYVGFDSLRGGATAADGGYVHRTGQQSNAVPVGWGGTGPDPRPFRRLGRVFELDQWPPAETGTAPERLKLRAHGHTGAGFAAYYPDCAGAFGMRDTLVDIDSDSTQWDFELSYQVTGWHADPADDPLVLAAADPARLAALRRQWAWTGAPARCLYAGQLAGLQWRKGSAYPTRVAEDASTRVAVGNSTSEALAALMKEEWKDPLSAPASSASDIPKAVETDVEFLLDAMQLSLLHRLSDQQWLPQLETALHRQGFAAYPGGSVWRLRGKQMPDDTPASAGTLATTLDPTVARSLQSLNALQRRRDMLAEAVTSRQRQLYMDWFQYLTNMFSTGDASSRFDQSDLATYIYGAIQALAPMRALLDGAGPESLSGQTAAAVAALKRRIGEAHPELTLQPVRGPRYWRPQDPVLVVTGNHLQRARRNGREPRLACRLSDALVAAPLPPPAAVSAGLRPPDPEASPGEARGLAPLLGDIAKVLLEAALLDPAQTPALRWPLTSLPAGWTGTLPLALAAAGPQDASEADPFLPLHLLWVARFWPVVTGGANGRAHDPDDLARHFAIDDSAIDLAPDPAAPPRLTPGWIERRGSVLLSSKAASPLAAQIRQLLDESPGRHDSLQALQQQLEAWPLLSQGLDGLTDLMLTRASGLQAAPFNPQPDNETYLPGTRDYTQTLTYAVAAAVGSETRLQPAGLEGGFDLLRAGRLDVASLQIVDVFGRRMQLFDADVATPATRIVPSWRLRPTVLDADGTSALGQMFLPPRLAQPARLRFAFLSASDDTVESDAANSPICGWVLPNHVENSLMLFAGDGSALGWLGLFGGHDRPLWQPVAGTEERDAARDLAAANPHLRRFAEGLLLRGADYFRAVLRGIDNANDYIRPNDRASAQEQAVLMGRPLAIVRAGLRLELQGLPAFNNGHAALQRDITAASHDDITAPSYDWRLRDCANALALRVPVHLGDRNRIEDGLVLLILGEDAAGLTIYAPSADAGSPVALAPKRTPISLTPVTAEDDPKPSAIITMLVDPRASLHASTGLLPVKQVSLPAEQYAAALGAIELALFTHPILRAGGPLALPLPTEAGFAWGWVTGVKQAGTERPRREPVLGFEPGDKARFGQGQLMLQDGWLALRPVPPNTPEDVP